MNYNQIIRKLRSMANPKNVEGMARFGINPKNTLGVSIYILRKIAADIGKDHALAQRLWRSGIHEAKILASYIDEPEKVTEKQMEKWVKGFDSWDVCDQVCFLFERTPFAYKKVRQWSKRKEEFVKRTAFSLIAGLSVHDKKAGDRVFEKFFPIIKREARDERNYVRKAVNWALRNIGKRNVALNRSAIKAADEINKIDSKTARWIAADALRELKSEKIRIRLRK
jgi:3-methyladenine DNA glycosylase AlkD